MFILWNKFESFCNFLFIFETQPYGDLILDQYQSHTMDEPLTSLRQQQRGGQQVADSKVPWPYFSRRRPVMKLSKSYEHIPKQQMRENWFDNHSIYSRKRNTAG